MNRNILLVEDEPGLVLTLGDRLRNEGYRVEAAFNGIEAEDRIGRDHVDLVILDLMLPGKDGLEVCRELRHRGFFNTHPDAHRTWPDRRQGTRAENRSG